MPYASARTTLSWYHKMERLQTRKNLEARRGTQSHNNNLGLHHSGQGAFERELERKGIRPQKYNLTTTTGAKRVAEMVVLRRLELEQRSKEAMAEQTKRMRQAKPSDWYNEADGPLNPNFLKSMQVHYDVPITDLPTDPILTSS
ncbi:hypothetical protein STCU_01575 [Strigomonas culicis]|nr:hypothetical protein STCU_01575 [Strigomonas culicis]|eukprot:EPY34456.1 hypothetical protein STCU_01575 [Strigomonas culicis]